MDTSGLCCPAFFSPGQLIGAQGDAGRLEAELRNLHVLSHPAGSKLTAHLHQGPLHSTTLPGCGHSFTPSGLLSHPLALECNHSFQFCCVLCSLLAHLIQLFSNLLSLMPAFCVYFVVLSTIMYAGAEIHLGKVGHLDIRCGVHETQPGGSPRQLGSLLQGLGGESKFK